MEVEIVDRKVDETWLSEVLFEIWEMVKTVRRKSCPRKKYYTLVIGPTTVQITVERI